MTQTSITTESIPTKSRYVKKTDKNTLECDKGEECNCNKIQVTEEEITEIELLELSLSDIQLEKSYNLIEINIELYNFRKGLQHIGIIKNQKDLEEVISILDKLEIIGERPLKHWEANHITCRLDIINPEYTVRTASIESTNEDLKEFKDQIKELLNLGVIRRSTSKHRSTAFMVRNHNEILRG